MTETAKLGVTMVTGGTTSESSQQQNMVAQIASAVENAGRLVVQNSASAHDHPIIIKNQRELMNQSLNKAAEEDDFSFRERTQGAQESLNEQSFLIESQGEK